MVNAPRYTGNLINHLSLDKNAYTDETQKAETVLSAVSYLYIYIYIYAHRIILPLLLFSAIKIVLYQKPHAISDGLFFSSSR